MSTPDRVLRAGVLGLCAVPLALSLWFVLVEPRPYFLLPHHMDVEADYLYNARLVLAGYGPSGTYHPGTPLAYLTALLLVLFGTDPADTQTVLNAAYVLIGLATTLALGGVTARVLRTTSPGVAALFVAGALSWSSTITYFNYLSPDALVVAVGIPLIWMCWASLSDPSYRRLVVLGAGCGLALALKFSFALLVLCIVAASAVRLFGARDDWAGAFGKVGTLGGCLVGGFCVGTLPVLNHMPAALLHTVLARLGPPLLAVTYGTPGAAAAVTAASAPDALLLVGPAFVIALAAFALAGAGIARRGTAGLRGWDVRAALVFAGLSAVILVVFFAEGVTLPLGLRHTAAVSLGIPFTLLLGATLLEIPARGHHRGNALSFFFAAALLTVVLWKSLDDRRALSEVAAREAAEAQHQLGTVAAGGQRLAVWENWDGVLISPATFHFWGNYRYGEEAFDALLLRAFPDHAHLRLRAVAAGMAPARLPSSDYPILESLRRHWGVQRPVLLGIIDSFDSLLKHRGSHRLVPTRSLFTSRAAADVGAVAVSVDDLAEELPPGRRPDFERRLREALGGATLRTLSINGEPWLIAERPHPFSTL